MINWLRAFVIYTFIYCTTVTLVYASVQQIHNPDKYSVIVELEGPMQLESITKLNGIQRQAHVQSVARTQKQFISLMQAQKIPVTVSATFSHAFNGFSLDINPTDISHIRLLPMVKKVHIVADKHLPPYQHWQNFTTQPTSNHNSLLRGKDITIAVLDSGIDYSHPDLGGCFGNGCKVRGGYNFLDGHADPMDSLGHGTHVAGIIAANGVMQGVAPEAELLAYKVCHQTCPVTAILQALEHALDPDGDPATDDGADIINMSLSGSGDIDDPVTVAVNNIVKRGITVIVAAGNEGKLGPQSIGSPANAELAITVGAVNHRSIPSDFSSQGPVFSRLFQKPDISALGTNVKSLQLKSGQRSMSGTSMATPYISGVVALLKQQHPNLSPKQLKSLVVNNASGINSTYIRSGNGKLDVARTLASKLVASDSQIMLGRLDRKKPQWQVKKSIKVTNISNETLTINAKIDHQFTTNTLSFSLLNPSTTLLSPGQSHTYTVEAKVSDKLEYPEHFIHQATLQINYSQQSLRLPILVLDAIEYVINTPERVKESWLYEHNNNGSYTQKFSTQSSYLLRPGSYGYYAWYEMANKHAIIAKTLNVHEDSNLTVKTSDAPYKVGIDAWQDHLGHSRELSDLEGFGVFFELANTGLKKRWSKFFTHTQNQVFVTKPVYVSALTNNDEFSFSFMYGDKRSSLANYHLYTWAQSISKIDKSMSIALDGRTSQIQLNVKPSQFHFDHWYLFNTLHLIRDNMLIETNTRGFSTSGRGFSSNDLPRSFDFSNEFKIHLHGNPKQISKVSFFQFQLNESKDKNRSISTAPFTFAQSTNLSDVSHQSVQQINLDWQNLITKNTQSNYGTRTTFMDSLIDPSGTNYGDFIEDSIFVCDDLIVAKRHPNTNTVNHKVFGQIRVTNRHLGCDSSKLVTVAASLVAGVPSLIATTQYGVNETLEEPQIELTELDYQAATHDVIKDTITVAFKVLVKTDKLPKVSVQAQFDLEGKWTPVTSYPAQVSGIEQQKIFRVTIPFPKYHQPLLTSLRLKFIAEETLKSILLADAIVLGGTINDLKSQDSDSDGINDAVDRDWDNDGMTNGYEILNQLDPYDPADAMTDNNQNGITNLVEFQNNGWSQYLEITTDSDADGYVDLRDAFPEDATEWADFDNDGVGNNRDTDDDDDSYLDEKDAFPLDPNEWLDSDNDSIGNNADNDDDNDGYHDNQDAFPLDPNEWLDSDNDGIGNNADNDDDNDGYHDNQDAFPQDSREWLDSDNDGVGNNADSDDDNDGYSDNEDAFPLDATKWSISAGQASQTKTPSITNSPTSSGGSLISINCLLLGLMFCRRKLTSRY